MQPAFLRRIVLPPPPSGPFRLPLRDGAGAWGAANRQETLRVQRADRYAVLGGEFENLVARPVEQRVRLEQTAVLIDFNGGDALALVGLVATQACHPDGGFRKRA